MQDGSIAQNQLKAGTSAPLAPVSSGFHNNGFNIISSLAPTNSTVGSSPKIVPTIATTAFPTLSRPQQISLNSENNIITNASDNRNSLVNVQLQQGPILIPSSNANITSSLPMQSVVAAVPPVATAQENTACSVQTGPASVQGGLMQVMGSTPCLIPQPNGLPPLIVNVPTANYVQVPTQPPSGCSLPLVNSLLAANILANTNMLNGGVNNILSQPNNNAPRPTLVTGSDNALFIAPPTLPGLNTGSTNVSTANINLNNLVACPQPRASVRPQFQVIHHTSRSSENKNNEAILASLDVPSGTAGIVLQKHSTDTTSNPSSLLASTVSPMEGDRKRLLLVKCQQPPTSRSGNVGSSTGTVVDPLSVVSHVLKDSIEDVKSPSIPQDNGILRHISNIHSYSKENEYEVKKGAKTDEMEILGSPSPSSSSNYLQPHSQGISEGFTNTTAWADPQGESNTRQSKNSGKCSKNTTNKGEKLKKLSENEPKALCKSGSAEKEPSIQEPEDSSDVGQDEFRMNSRVTVEQTDSLNGSNTESINVSSDPQCNEVTLKAKIEIQEDQIKMEGAQLNSLSKPSFSFTQYAADSPYPAASLNFSSVWNNLVPQGERKDSKVAPMASSSSSMCSKVQEINPTNIKKEVVGSDYVAPIDTINNMNSSMEPSLIKSEIVAEEDSLTNDSEDVSVPSFNNNHAQSRTSNDEGNR